MIKLLVVDDSAFMRVAIRKMVEGDPKIKLVGEAKDGAVAVRMVEELNPDVVTMDIEMPVMDGLEATRRIMERLPRPVIMLSSLTQAGAPATFKALELGAVDFISKASSFVQLDIVQIQNDLLQKIHHWGTHRLPFTALSGSSARQVLPAPSEVAAMDRSKAVSPRGAVDLVVVGVSTGGPRMLPEMLRAMGRLTCPVVVAQHMPALFTKSFAQHLHEELGSTVVEGEAGMVLQSGMVVILPGGRDGTVRRHISGNMVIAIQDAPDPPTIHPSVNLLFESAAAVARNPVAAILTGMGSDGTRGAREFAAKGWPVLVQEPATCVVGGMPESAIGAGVASEMLTLDKMGLRLARWAGTVGSTLRF